MKKVYTAALATVMAAVVFSAVGFISVDTPQSGREVMNIGKNQDCDGDQDRDRVQDRLQDGSCQEAIVGKRRNALAISGAGSGDRDGSPDQDQDQKRDGSCLAAAGALAGDRDSVPDQDREQKKDQSC